MSHQGQTFLVGLGDGPTRPKVIDFGVAKAIGQSMTDRTLYTGVFYRDPAAAAPYEEAVRERLAALTDRGVPRARILDAFRP